MHPLLYTFCPNMPLYPASPLHDSLQQTKTEAGLEKWGEGTTDGALVRWGK